MRTSVLSLTLLLAIQSIVSAQTVDLVKEQVNENDTVVLVLLDYIGELQWQSSQDSMFWADIVGANSDSLLIIVKEHSFFRAKVTVGICDPYYSDIAYIENAWDIDNDSDGFTENQGDCNDTIPEISPGAFEIPNNDIDEDCDGIALIIDEDNDGYSTDEDCNDQDSLINPGALEIPNNNIDENCDGIALIIDEDNDGYNSDEDCNDQDSLINPGAIEIPNNYVDENCDNILLNFNELDADDDGYNFNVDCNDQDSLINPGAIEIPNNGVDEDCDGIALIIDEDNDGYNSDVDCNDQDSLINQGAIELPNNDVDENCDGIAWIIDEDNDGYNSDEDCNDQDSLINPGAIEILNNGADDDCDGIAWIIDEDNDGYNSYEDCNDQDSLINPGALDIPNNGVDEDCDGIALVIDEDDDGYNSDEDCDDQNSQINPGAIEIPNNGVDDNCDGIALIIDEDNDGYNSDEDCNDQDSLINPGALDIPNNGVDEDCDGVALVIDEDDDGYNSDEDCDDQNSQINPGAIEIPNNGVDDNCDGIALIIDEDDDGYNSDEDCDDQNSLINPGAIEIPNNDVDEDCDGIALIIDEDDDGYNSDEDCDDQNSLINPGAFEIPNNGVDDNCDGTIDWDGMVMTVNGLIQADAMGITLPHEHLLIVHKGDNRDLTNETHAISELQYYVDAGGITLTELSNIGIGRDPEGLKRISTATGINVIMGSGFYKDAWISDFYKSKSIEELTDIIINDIVYGINGIHAGVIGEIGISRPITPFEEKVVIASARAQKATGAAVNLHFDRDGGIAERHYVLDILESEGVDLSRVYISHNTPLVNRVDNFVTYAQRGCYVEFDMLGMEILFPFDDDMDLTATIKALINRGYIDRILISQDVCFTGLYVRNGGYGYAHILNDLVPQMKAGGITDAQIHTIMVENPKRLLSF